MVRTAIRPDDYVEFRDPSTKAVVFSTADSSRVYLSELDEGTAEVKSITVDVPAADGALDLTESVAGRPLYGNRAVTMTVSLVCADHPAAVAAVQSARRAIHGRMLEVETPDTRVSEGWLVGRVSIDSVEYPGEAAVLHITANCKPWVFYGTGTVALTAGTPTVVTEGYMIPSADRERIGEAVIEVEQPNGIWSRKSNYAYAGYPPQRMALVQSNSPNVFEYGTMGHWVAWECGQGGTGWGTSWSRNSALPLAREVDIDASELDETSAYRIMLVSDAGTDGIERGLMVTDLRGTVRVVVQVGVESSVPGTPAAGIDVIIEGTRRPAGPTDASGGLFADADKVTQRVTVWDGTGDDGHAVVDIDPADILPGTAIGSDYAAGYITFGIEARWVSASIEMTVEMFPEDWPITPGESTGYIEPDNIVTFVDLPSALYSSGALRNVATIAPYGSMFTEALAVPSGSAEAEEVTPARTLQMAAGTLSGRTTTLRAYGVTNRGWMQLDATVTLYPWATAEFDAGDMPTAFLAALPSPAMFEAEGSRVTMASDGTLPFTLSGTTELAYMVMGGQDGTLTFERGTV